MPSHSSRHAICVYCGSTGETIPAHRKVAENLGEILAQTGTDLVFGGGHIGLMGVLADTLLDRGGKVTGIIPEFLKEWEVAHNGLSELLVVKSMHERKQIMFERSDAFVILPGGLGTLDEFLEVLTWKQLGLHKKPVILVNADGFWQPLRALFEHLMEKGYAGKETGDLLQVIETVEEIRPILENLPAAKATDSALRL